MRRRIGFSGVVRSRLNFSGVAGESRQGLLSPSLVVTFPSYIVRFLEGSPRITVSFLGLHDLLVMRKSGRRKESIFDWVICEPLDATVRSNGRISSSMLAI